MNLREIDRLIAEWVMRWSRYSGVGWPCCPCFDDRYGRVELIFGITEDSFKSRTWHPTEDIAAAWEVVAKMATGRPFLMDCRNLMLGGFRIRVSFTDIEIVNTVDEEFGGRVRQFQAIADTAPLAICLAALRANGVEVPA